MKLLHIDSSILGDASASRQLSAELVQPGGRTKTGLTSLTATWPPTRWRISPP